MPIQPPIKPSKAEARVTAAKATAELLETEVNERVGAIGPTVTSQFEGWTPNTGRRPVGVGVHHLDLMLADGTVLPAQTPGDYHVWEIADKPTDIARWRITPQPPVTWDGDMTRLNLDTIRYVAAACGLKIAQVTAYSDEVALKFIARR